MSEFVKSLIKDILIAVVIVVAISFVIKPTIVKEHSMEPTLYGNDYLIVNKLAYISKEHPARGDIIVFESDLPRTDGVQGTKLLIKRVIATEGDVVTLSEGYVYVNGKRLDEPYVNDQGSTWPDGEDIVNMTVPQDKLFCLGDNRMVSRDSRDPEVGLVDEDRVMGKAFVRLFPFNEIRLL
ncbi:MAG: signal peptidase I [Clostridiales bacterium]|nr:signal peptidase I [Clostridiales bacterium]MDD7035367.1 signal peptidase I [Bacillota bacterium]MDY2920188.1 signal peptidase I [Lentihominibacter sp.]